MKPSPLLMACDGTNLMVRAAFGYSRFVNGNPEPLRTTDGRVTSGLYGSVLTFLTYYKKALPTHSLWCFDYGKSTYRLSIDSQYKANRLKENDDKVDLELPSQYTAFDEFLSLVGAKSYREQGVEADDLLACSTRWSEQIPTVIVSVDHDLRQLVSPSVAVLKPSMGTNKSSAEKLYQVEQIEEEYGLPPTRLAEMWALTGDPSDNIEGVRGIGPKRALKILQEYPNLHEALSQHPRLKGLGFEDRVYRNYSMIKLDGSCAQFDVSLEECAFQPSYSDELRDFFSEWEFESLIKRFDERTLWS